MRPRRNACDEGEVEGIVYGQVESTKAAVEEAPRRLAACKRHVKRLVEWSWVKKSITEARLLSTLLLSLRQLVVLCLLFH